MHILVGAVFVNQRHGVTAGGQRRRGLCYLNSIGTICLVGLLVWVVLNP